MDDRKEFYHALRSNTAALLNYDIDKLTLTQSLKVDLASSLRIEIDRITAAQLKGESVDLRELVLATESLSRLVAPDGTGTDGDFETRHRARCQEEFAGAHEKLSQLLSAQHERVAARDASHPDEARLKFERELQAKIDKCKTIPPKPTIEWVRDGTHCFFSEGFDPNAEGRRHGFVGWVRPDPPPVNTRPGADLDAPPKPTTPPEQTTSPQPPLPPPSDSPPASYLQHGNEPWRPYVATEGGIRTPLAPPGSDRSRRSW